MNEFKTYVMQIKIDRKNKIFFFEEDYPVCTDIPEIMKTEYPFYTTRIMSYEEFDELDYPAVGRRVLWEEG